MNGGGDDSAAFKRMNSAISDDSDNDVSAKMFKGKTDNVNVFNDVERGMSVNSQVSGIMEHGG